MERVLKRSVALWASGNFELVPHARDSSRTYVYDYGEASLPCVDRRAVAAWWT